MDQDSIPNTQTAPKSGRRWIRALLEVILFCILWIPIVLTGIHNVREQIGKGEEGPWNTIGAKLSGWGLWLVGVFIWYVAVSGVGRFILKKLGLLKSPD